MDPPQDGRFDSLLAVVFSLCPKQHNSTSVTTSDGHAQRRMLARSAVVYQTSVSGSAHAAAP